MQLHSKIRKEPSVLLQMLSQALLRQRAWKPVGYQLNCKQGVEIGGPERDRTIRWLAQLNQQFRFYPETFALSVAILDRFLHTVKARPKYLRCIGIACFYLASKTVEEDEVIPGTFDLVRETGCGCTVSEVLRMEKCILDKLHWSIRYVTYTDFLHIVHSLLLSKNPHLLDSYPHVTATRQLGLVTDKLQLSVGNAALAGFLPATLAITAISIELEQFCPNWLPLTLWMRALCQVDLECLIRCRETMSRVLASSQQSNILGVYTSSATLPSSKATKRKMEDMEEDDDIYDGIKRLYNEEEGPKLSSSCAREAFVESSASVAATVVAN